MKNLNILNVLNRFYRIAQPIDSGKIRTIDTNYVFRGKIEISTRLFKDSLQRKNLQIILGNLTKTNHKQTLQSDIVGGVQTILVVDVINVKRVVSRYFFVC